MREKEKIKESIEEEERSLAAIFQGKEKGHVQRREEHRVDYSKEGLSKSGENQQEKRLISTFFIFRVAIIVLSDTSS